MFDWHLLWFVQYTDILTFGLIAVGVISGSLTFIQSASQTVISLLRMSGWSRRGHTVVLVLLVLGIVAFEMWGAIRRGEGYFHILFGVTVLGLGVVLILHIVGYIATATIPGGTQSFFLLLLTGFATVSLGQWLGYSVLEHAKAQESL